jgi:aminoglycoside phosphotransferase family enzyme
MAFKTIRGVKVFINPTTGKIAENANGHDTVTRADLETAFVKKSKLEDRLETKGKSLSHDQLRSLATRVTEARQRHDKLQQKQIKENKIRAEHPEDFK